MPIQEYVRGLEEEGGLTVYWPYRDTKQDDPDGFQICQDNCDAMKASENVHVWYDSSSQGSVFDLGMAFIGDKLVPIANPEEVQPTVQKSFQNVLLELDRVSKKDETADN